MRRGSKGIRRKGRKGNAKGIKMCYVHVPTPQKECKHYVLKNCTSKKLSHFLNKLAAKYQICI